MFGDDYIAQHIQNEIHKQSQEMLYRAYITDALMAISSRDQKMSRRYVDIFKELFSKPKKEKDQSPEEIRDRIREKLKRLMGKEEEEQNGFDDLEGDTWT